MSKCPYNIGDKVIFTPTDRTRGWYQQVFDKIGMVPGREYVIKRIKDDTYLYFENDDGGFPWTEYTKA